MLITPESFSARTLHDAADDIAWFSLSAFIAYLAGTKGFGAAFDLINTVSPDYDKLPLSWKSHAENGGVGFMAALIIPRAVNFGEKVRDGSRKS